MPGSVDVSETFEALERRRLEELTAIGITEDEARAVALDEWHSLQKATSLVQPAAFSGWESLKTGDCLDLDLDDEAGPAFADPPPRTQASESQQARLHIARSEVEVAPAPAPKRRRTGTTPPARVSGARVAAAAAGAPARRGDSQGRGACGEDGAADDWIRPGVPAGPLRDSDEEDAEGSEVEDGADAAQEPTESRVAAFRRSRLLPHLGGPHPDWLTEPIAIARVPMPALTAEATLRLPRRLAEKGLLSSPQLEAVAYAARRFRTTLPDGSRAGYYLGDGTGTGKGRVIAALVWHLWNEGARRHLWLSASADLLEDARRDLRDLGAPLPVAALGDMPYGKIAGAKTRGGLTPDGDGVLFATYSLLVASKSAGDKEGGLSCRGGSSRLAQVVDWLGGAEARGMVAFDEAHKAKNTGAGGDSLTAVGASKTGICVTQLQRSCPGVACLYASATGATEIKHLGYMERLGLVGLGRPHRTFDELRSAVERGGLAAMELIAITMRAEGMLSCRALSFRGASFGLRVAKLSNDQSGMYASAATLWQKLFHGLLDLLKSEKERLRSHFGKRANQHLDTAQIMRHFWAVQQRFFRQLLVCLKVERAVKMAEDALIRGEQVVISMWSTGEAQTEARLSGVLQGTAKRGAIKGGAAAVVSAAAVRRATAESLESFVCGLEVMVERLLQHAFEPLANGTKGEALLRSLRDTLKKAKFPANPLDTLLAELGGPEKVAELTGRSRRLVATASGSMLLDERAGPTRAAAERTNITEQRAFQEGRKRVAIITEAASAGISLHSERREGASQAQRYMLTLELPWEADKAVQQLGRVHRSNQARPPRFAVLLTELGGECRFASAIARRMRLLGAITRGDRGAAADVTGGLADFDVQNRYGKRALDHFYRLLRTHTRLPVQLETVGPGKRWREADSFYKASEVALTTVGIRLDTDDKFDDSLKEGKGLNTFLNRILMLPPDMQNALFEVVHSLYEYEVRRDQAAGTYDAGLETLNRKHGQRVRVETISKEVLFKDPLSGAETTYVRLRLDHGMPWEAAERLQEDRCEEVRGDGPYWWRIEGPPGSPEVPALAVAAPGAAGPGDGSDDDEDERPLVLHTARGAYTRLPGCSRRSTHTSLISSGRLRPARLQERADFARAWRANYAGGGELRADDSGSRFSEEHVLGGSILNVWGAVGAAVRSNAASSTASSTSERLPLLRARPEGADEVVVGVRVDAARLQDVRYALNALLESRAAAAVAPEADVTGAESATSAARATGAAGVKAASAAVPTQAAIDPPAFDVVHELVKTHLKALPGECDESWEGWSQVHKLMVERGLADNSADCVVAVQHWVEELLRLRVLEREPESGGLRLRYVPNHSGWYMPPPKPKPLPRRGRGRGGRGRGRGRSAGGAAM